jgi:ABC-2 type transport system permease protein
VNAFLAGVRSEFTKIGTTRMWWLLAIVLFLYIGLISGGLATLFGLISTGKITRGNTESGSGAAAAIFHNLAPVVYSFATSVGYVFPVLLGALATTGEYRHQTLTPTFLANPRRGQVLGAKVTSTFIVGAVYGVIALVAAVGIGALALSIVGVDTALGDSATWAQVGRSILAMALWALIGVGLGTLVPNQVATIVIVLAFTQFVEPLLRLATSFSEVTANIGKFLPGAASDALVGASVFTISSPAAATAAALEWWQGGLVLAAYAAVFVIAGYFVSWRRDIS